MLASTLPVQWLLPTIGWRWMFGILAFLLLLAMGLMVIKLPEWRLIQKPDPSEASAVGPSIMAGYAQVWRNPYFQRLTPIGFFNYGGLIAMQTYLATIGRGKVGFTQTHQAPSTTPDYISGMRGVVERNIEVDDDALGFIAADELNPQKARVLLLLGLTRTGDPHSLQDLFFAY